MSAEEQRDPVGQTLGKRFLVRRVIGVGGMGVVYEVEHVVTKKRGALKLLHASLAAQPRTVERFVREASAAARIENPHIVETYDAGELESGEPYMFMELLTGSALRELLFARGPLRFAEAREIVLQAAEGLAAAHAAGIVHRDIKPENLFVVSGEPAYVKILDFGISKFSLHTDHRLTSEGAPMGTPYYMSPEQVAGKSDLDERSDVYALGVVLYECVTGSVPFDAPTLPALSIKIFEGRYTPPSGVTTDTPARLDEVVARAMAVEPSTRFSSMNEFRAALEALGAPGAPVSLSATLASVAGRAPSLRTAPPYVTSPRTASLGAELGVSEAPAAPGATPSERSSELAGARLTPEAKAITRGKLGLTLGAGAAVIASAAVVWNAVQAPPVLTEEARAPSDERSPGAASAPPPAVTPAPSEPLPSAPEPSAAPVTSEVANAVAGAPAVRRPRAPKPNPSAPSRAARDGLSEDNPFGQ
jgi:tRNA A-37 threonylcarbamoyl transferase component Bud32